ncbi:sulfite exporter TauE/SafE family protein [Streptomyces ureilyticus]|uniref:Probable membrane transporter protein n=1 Tax=Streptomyces ureilyticus TaxID=1775131 RepID=A0ABX0E2Z5_9ACTN|nr:sulfite exporter TauE/SafE family protein [Streptomyces ureilyticus]NGO47255.1 sulfite exporter TauE/SafE family protein [Streptomyces ureilyticus]
MLLEQQAVLLLVGILAGIACTVVNIASLISYPALLSMGLPPVVANATNTVSLVFTGFGATLGSRPELEGQRSRVIRFGAINAIGGAVGAVTLIVTSPDVFQFMVPILVAGASVLLLLQPRINRMAAGPVSSDCDAGDHFSLLSMSGMFAVSVYTGYFGAAGGILAVALLGVVIDEPLVRINAIKNATNILANSTASVIFIIAGSVHYGAALPLAAGFLLGGGIGPLLARKISRGLLRSLAGISGLLFAAKLGVEGYG